MKTLKDKFIREGGRFLNMRIQRWRAYACAMLVTCVAGAAVTADRPTDIVRFDASVPLETADIPAELRVPGRPIAPKYSFKVLFDSPQLEAGIWEGGPGFTALNDFPGDEVVYIVRGDIVARKETDDSVQRFGQGDHFIVPKGFTGTWEMSTKTTLLFSYVKGESSN